MDNISKLLTFSNNFLFAFMKEKKSVILMCSECLSRNYVTNKVSSSNERIELMKYCSKCNKHTLHKETK